MLTACPPLTAFYPGDRGRLRVRRTRGLIEETCVFEAGLDPGVDADLDGYRDGCDCEPANPAVFPGAWDVNDGLDNQCAGSPGHGVTDELR